MNNPPNQNQARLNYLLAALPNKVLMGILPKLELALIELGDLLYKPDEKVDFVYFPTTAVINLVHIMENGAVAGIGITGNEGMIGISQFMGVETVNNRALVQSAGETLKMKTKDLQNEFNQGGVFQILLLRFTMAMMAQISQTAVCNRLHSIEQQLCRWLLLTHDRLTTDKIIMTHDQISSILGVQRASITLAVHKLTIKNLIVNGRGAMRIINRIGLEAAVCECYKVVNVEYNRLLGRGLSRTFN
ncbi:MAG TPA: Crp/Fnr family transcriptional regulator [Pyrinomonadaceae bacterium]|nr:Crp/Fnr family transcriptional regulator [Pyrinomonadaceae bacterium]